jgi:phosphatidylserine/phosphatidylglycerophosphate/cardiolipin synthase-like enzyme
VMPRSADGWLEQKAMDGARVQLARAIAKVDPQRRFRIYVPVTPGGADIYVHAKVAVVDDRLLRVGSSNMNNRSLGLDSECDVIIDCALAANADAGGAIADLRCELLAEHLGVAPDVVAASFVETASLHATIAALNGQGRHLDILSLDELDGVEEFIADNELLDPENADGFFEPLHKRSIWKSWRKGLAWRPKFGRGKG